MRKSNLRISVFTKIFNPDEETSHKKVSEYLQQILDALDKASEHHADLLVTPGYSFGNGNISPKQEKVLQDKIDETNVGLIAEMKTSDTRYFSPKTGKGSRMTGQFNSSTNIRLQNAKQTLKDLADNRTISLEDKTIGLLLCGEINILKCVNHKDPEPRYASLNFPKQQYDIWINPAHTLMGEAHLTQKKLSFLSKGNSIAIHCANNNSQTKDAKRSIYIYKDGEQIVDGTLEKNPAHLNHIEDEWRIVTIEI